MNPAERANVMKNDTKALSGKVRWAVMLLLVIGVTGSASLLSVAHPPATAVTVVNNSSREISHLYLSPTNVDSWGPDQLTDATIGAGTSFTLNNVSCTESALKVITEDADGCFLYKVVTCGENTTWTITADDTPDCGG
jgi:hypothetical protein